MKIGRNIWGCPLIATGTTYGTKRRYLEINEGGRWFNALWIFGRELILAFNVLGFIGTVHWHINWGWKPEINRFNEKEIIDANNRD